MGNVCRAVMRPPGHSGKAKKGHLSFDASFETGNLGFVELISQYEYDLFIRPDTCNPRLRLWFNFTVDNSKTDQKQIFRARGWPLNLNISTWELGRNHECSLCNLTEETVLHFLGRCPVFGESRMRWLGNCPTAVLYLNGKDRLSLFKYVTEAYRYRALFVREYNF